MENQEDHDFVRRLQEITGNQVIWEPAPAEISTASAEEVAGLLYGDHGSSDDEMEMVLGMSHLNANGEAKKLPQSGQKQIGKVPKAPLKMSRKKEVARLEDAAKSWKMPSLKKGEESHEGDYFTPWKFVQGYPNMYVGKRNGERAAPFFEHEEILENRVWDLYYLRYPPNVDRKPVLFVPTTQLQNLLDVVNAKLEDTNLTIPDGKNAEKFYMTFGAGQTPRPRFLGRSTSLLSFEDLKTSFPPLQSGEALDRATPLAKDDFLDRLDMIHKAGFKDGKNKSEANRRKKIAKHRSWGQQVKRVQRYLGLRPRAPTEHTDDLPLPQSLDLARPITLEPEGSVVFVAIDVEAYEFNQDMITEVGVAILDTNDLKSVAPGEGGVDWHELIKAHHIRIRENVWAVNRKHVRGCPDQFNFGYSLLLEPLAEAAN